MMAKIVKGGSFGGCVGYVMGKKDAKLLDAEGVLLESKVTVADSFEAQSGLNPRLGRKVGHISLNFSAQDKGRIDNAFMVKVAGEYMQKMGITNTQYIVVRHNDREHPHCHIVFNRVDNDGKTITDQNDRVRSVKACRTLTEKYGLYLSPGKENVNRQQLRDPDSVKYVIYDTVKAALPNCKSWGDLERRLEREGISVTFKYSGDTDMRQGVIFGKDGFSFNGSKIDRQFSFSKLDAALNGNAQAHTTTLQPDHRQYSEPSHSHSHGNSGDSILGVFTIEPGPAESDNDPPKPKKKKKKKKQQYKPSF